MTKSILTISAWKLFLGFVVGLITAWAIAFSTAKYFEWNMEYGPYPTLQYGLMGLMLWSYPYLAGRAVGRRSWAYAGTTPHRKILLIILLAILNNVIREFYIEVYGLHWVVVLISGLLDIYCMWAVVSFPARMLKSVELKRKATISEYWREIPRFVVWPFSIWWTHPTLASIAIEEEVFNKNKPVSE